MAHAFDSGVFANTPAWHGLGLVYDEPENGKLYPAKALELGGLNWDVELVPVELFGVETGDNILVRGDRFAEAEALIEAGADPIALEEAVDAARLGMVGSRYQPIQNHEGMNMLTKLVDDGDLHIETAISLKGGKLVVVLAHRPEPILIAGEANLPYIMAAIRHAEGSTSFLYTPTRVVCTNTYAVAIDGAKNRYDIRHTANAQMRLEEAREALEMSFDYTDELQKIGNELAAQKISNGEFDKFLKDLILDPPKDDDKNHERAKKIRAEAREAIKEVYRTSDNLGNIRGTKWGAFQAVVDYDVHARKRTPEQRMTAIFDKDNYDQRAMNLLLAK